MLVCMPARQHHPACVCVRATAHTSSVHASLCFEFQPGTLQPLQLNLTWRVGDQEDVPELVPQHAICWPDRDIQGSPIQLTVLPGLIEAASARMLLSSHTLQAGETRHAALFFQVTNTATALRCAL